MSIFADSPRHTDPFASTPAPTTPTAPKRTEPTDGSRPTAAFVGVSWLALVTGMSAYLIGLWNATMQLNEKGYYLTLMLYGLFAAVTVQKAVRDRQEDVPVTSLFSGLAWASVLIVASLLTIGLWNAGLARSEKGFYAMSMALATFGAVAVQKNVRDIQRAERDDA